MSANLPPKDKPAAPRTPSGRERPSERIFRRSRAARNRRSKSDKSDFRFISIVLQLSVLVAMVLVAGAVFAQKAIQSPQNGYQDGTANAGGAFLTPVFAGLSLVEIGVIAFVIIMAGILLWQWRRK